MPPSGVIGLMDEEAAIEAQIQLELEAINLDDDNQLYDSEDDDDLDVNDNIQEQQNEIELPHELDNYIKTIQEQSSKFEQELLECDSILNPTVEYEDRNLALIPYDDQTLLVELARERGCSIEEYKKQILEEIANDDDIIVDELAGLIDEEEVPALENGPADGEVLAITQNGEAGLDGRMEVDIQKAVEEGMAPEEVPVSQDLIPLNGQQALPADIQKLLREQLERLEAKYENRLEKLKKDEAYRRDEEDVQQRRMEEERQWKRQEIEREARKIAMEREAAEKESKKQQEKAFKDMEKEMKKYEEKIAHLQAETERQRRDHEMAIEQEKHRQEEKREKAAVKIQSKFRSYKVRKEVGQTLTEKKEIRMKQREDDRIKEVEIEIEQWKEEKRIKEEKKKEEEAEAVRLEEEKKRLKEEEKRQKEEEKRQREEEKKRLKEEEERKKQEEKIKKEEEKQRKKEEEKRKKEEEKKRKEEEKIRKEEEKRQKEEEERRKKEEEKRLKEEEKQRKIEEKKLKEEEEKRKKEELQCQQENEKKKIEEAEVRKTEETKETVQERQTDVKELTDNEQGSGKQSIENIGKENAGVRIADELNVGNKTVNEQVEVTNENVSKSSDKPIVEESKLNNDVARPETPRTKTTRSARKRHTLTPRKSLKEEVKSLDEGDTKEKEKPENLDCLPEQLENLRLQFIKQCLPWSKVANEPWKLKTGISKKPLRRPASAKKLPLLPENLITEAAKVASIKQVTTVQLSELPGNNISSLGQCWGLKYLSLTNSNLVAVDGLSQCKQLQYLDVRNNRLEFIDVKDIGQLQYVNASHNKLTSIHGLDNCTNLRWLDLSHNNITRLDGLEVLRRLTTLRLSHNQLISTQGLGTTPTVQILDLSHNHLQALEDADKLCLLSSLDLSSNNLLEVPKLTNQVLLQELLIEDNSISCLTNLAATWLPLLIKLVISHNSIEELPVLENCLLLKDVDLSNNQLLESDMLFKCLEKCVFLENLEVKENPVTDDLNEGFYQKLQTVCPRLQKEQQGTNSSDPIKPRTSFETMCLTQSNAVRNLKTYFDNNLKSLSNKGPSADLAQMCDIHFKFCDKLFNTLVEYRYAHEYGEVSITVPSAPKTPKSGRPQSARQKEKFLSPKDLFENALKGSGPNGAAANMVVNGDSNMTRNNSNIGGNEIVVGSNPKDMFEQALKSTGVSSSNPKDMFEQALQATGNSSSNPKDIFEQALKSAEGRTKTGQDGTSSSQNNGVKQPVSDQSINKRTSAAITIQAFFRGWSIRHDISEQTKIWLAVTTIQAAWRGYRVRKITLPEIFRRRAVANVGSQHLMKMNASATKIQAIWKGYILRKKLLAALEYAQCNFSDEEIDDPDIMDMNDEFDVDKFLDFDENQLDSDWMPPETPDIPSSHAVLKKPPSGKPRIPPINTYEARPPSNPRDAWKMGDMSSLSGHDKLPRPPSSVASTNITARTGMSKKEEKITEEWGFKDSSTAHLMMQRAKKMKYNAERRKKIRKLDPKQRLALFRKLEEDTHHPTTQVPQRKTLPRKEYFQARQDEINQQEQEKREEFHTRVSRTFEWLHTQVGDHPVSDSIINQMGPRYAHNSHNLPELQGGKRVQLVSSPGSIELQSVDSASTLGQNARRFSAGSTGSSSRLPPIQQTNSAPAANHHLKERMSFRNPKTNTDVGWGGGRKRANKF